MLDEWCARYSDDDVKKALAKAELGDFVFSLANGMDTVVAGAAGMSNLAQEAAIAKAKEIAAEAAADEAAAKLAEAKAAEVAAAAAGKTVEEMQRQEKKSKPSRSKEDNSATTTNSSGFMELSIFHAQLICLARIILRKPSVVLFDCVARHITRRTERKVIRTIVDKMADLDTAIIASDRVRFVLLQSLSRATTL